MEDFVYGKEYGLPKGITAHDIRVNTRVWKEVDATTYWNQPDSATLITLMNNICSLNDAAKNPNFPIKKTNFYNIKSDFIRWCIMQAKTGTRSDVSYSIDRLEAAPGDCKHVAVALDITIAGQTWHIHQILESPLRWILYGDILGQPIQDFRRTNPTAPCWPNDVIALWQDTLSLIEDNNWFIIDDADMRGWFDIIRKRYPKLFTAANFVNHNWKLGTMLTGGPMMILCNDFTIKLVTLRRNFRDVLRANELAESFTLALKHQ